MNKAEQKREDDMGIGHSVSTNHKSDYVIAYNGAREVIQIVESGQDHIHWLIIRQGSIEQKVALDFSMLLLLCKAISLLPQFDRIKAEQE